MQSGLPDVNPFNPDCANALPECLKKRAGCLIIAAADLMIFSIVIGWWHLCSCGLAVMQQGAILHSVWDVWLGGKAIELLSPACIVLSLCSNTIPHKRASGGVIGMHPLLKGL